MDWLLIVSGASLTLNAVVVGFWKPWLGAYGGEKGKNLARKEDLAGILAEVRAVTITQKEIEATLNSGIWNRQTLWIHKRDAYADVIKVGGQLARQYGKIASCSRFPEPPGDGSLGYANGLNKLFDESISIMSELSSAGSLASLFVSSEAESLIDALSVSIAAPKDNNVTAAWAMNEGIRISTEVGRLLRVAKNDLNLAG